MNCTQARELLPLYADGDLDEGLARGVGRHLETCPACRRRLERDRHLTTLLETLDAPETVPEGDRSSPVFVKPSSLPPGKLIEGGPTAWPRSSTIGLIGLALIGALAVVFLIWSRPPLQRPNVAQAMTATVTPTPVSTVTPAPASPVSFVSVPPPNDEIDLYRRFNPTSLPNATPTPFQDEAVGTEHTFEVPVPAPATSRAPMPARLAAKTAHAEWYVQDGLNLPASDVLAATDSFEGQAYPTIHRLDGWNVPPSIDGNPRITVLIGHLPALSPVAFGYGDLAPRWIYPQSNERKLLYVNADAVQFGTPPFIAEITFSLSRLAWQTSHPGQDYWVEGGTDLLAAQEASGSLSNILDPNAPPVFALHPDVQLNAWRPEQANPTSLSLETVHYLFARYVADRFGDSRVFPLLFGAPGRDLAAYDEVFHHLTPPTSFDAVFGDWVAANVLDDPSLDDGRYGYRSGMTLHPQVLPGPTLGQSIGGQATQFGASYYQVQPTAAATLLFTGDMTVPLIAANPRSGGYEWWSNHGDLIDSRLTRPVDLRAVEMATLRFWAWYEIEKDADYAYVEVSTDGGATWRTLRATDTTGVNPRGANPHDGFTGTSGGTPPRWIQETVDLTPYSGRLVLLRFEYVTDLAIQGDGFALDDVEIPEINFRDPATSDDGWTAEGFVRTSNVVPQSWLVEVISSGQNNPVRRLPMAPDGTASLDLQANEKVVVAIAGLAPDTTQKPTYQLRLTPRQG